MRELQFIEPKRIEWREVPEPVSTPLGTLVRPVAVGTCDLDSLIANGHVPVPGPFALGHEFVADVVEVGDEVRDVAPGDRISVSFQINCGRCRPCLRGSTGRCTSVLIGSAYGMGLVGATKDWGGAVADLVHVPFADAMSVRIPATADPVPLAGLSDNLVDGYRTVAPYLEAADDKRVLVFGAKSVGLYAAGIARALGATVTYVDADPANCAVAEQLGATVINEHPVAKYASHPIVVHSTVDADILRTAVRSTAGEGVLTNAGPFFTDVSLPMLEMYTKGITFVTGRVNARALMPAALELVTSGWFDPAPMVTQTATWDDAAEAWAQHSNRLVLVR